MEKTRVVDWVNVVVAWLLATTTPTVLLEKMSSTRYYRTIVADAMRMAMVIFIVFISRVLRILYDVPYDY